MHGTRAGLLYPPDANRASIDLSQRTGVHVSESSRPKWPSVGVIAFAALLALTVASCSGDDTSSDTSSQATESACEQAFSQAASVSDMQDTIGDLYPAIRACKTVNEWTAASNVHPDALDGADPVVFLTNACMYATASDIADTGLCESLG